MHDDTYHPCTCGAGCDHKGKDSTPCSGRTTPFIPYQGSRWFHACRAHATRYRDLGVTASDE